MVKIQGQGSESGQRKLLLDVTPPVGTGVTGDGVDVAPPVSAGDSVDVTPPVSTGVTGDSVDVAPPVSAGDSVDVTPPASPSGSVDVTPASPSGSVDVTPASPSQDSGSVDVTPPDSPIDSVDVTPPASPGDGVDVTQSDVTTPRSKDRLDFIKNKTISTMMSPTMMSWQVKQQQLMESILKKLEGMETNIIANSNKCNDLGEKIELISVQKFDTLQESVNTLLESKVCKESLNEHLEETTDTFIKLQTNVLHSIVNVKESIDSLTELNTGLVYSVDRVDNIVQDIKTSVKAVIEEDDVLHSIVNVKESIDSLTELNMGLVYSVDRVDNIVQDIKTSVETVINDEDANINQANNIQQPQRSTLEGMYISEKVSVENSEFQGFGKKINNRNEAYSFVSNLLQSEYMQEMDHCYSAYVLLNNPVDIDEGKGSSTIKNLLFNKQNIVVVVLRKFGGKHIGMRRWECVETVTKELLGKIAPLSQVPLLYANVVQIPKENSPKFVGKPTGASTKLKQEPKLPLNSTRSNLSKIVMFTDSVGKLLNSDRLFGQSSVEMRKCFKLDQIISNLESSSSNDQVQKVIIHCGINDVVNGVNTEIISNQIETIVRLAKQKFTSADIFVSHLLSNPENNELKRYVNVVNKSIWYICSKTNSTMVSHNKLNSSSDFFENQDDVQINAVGTKLFASNIMKAKAYVVINNTNSRVRTVFNEVKIPNNNVKEINKTNGGNRNEISNLDGLIKLLTVNMLRELK